MKWTILLIVGVLVISLLVFLIMLNQKDEAEFEKEQNNDYPKPKDDKDNSEIDELKLT